MSTYDEAKERERWNQVAAELAELMMESRRTFGDGDTSQSSVSVNASNGSVTIREKEKEITFTNIRLCCAHHALEDVTRKTRAELTRRLFEGILGDDVDIQVIDLDDFLS